MVTNHHCSFLLLINARLTIILQCFDTVKSSSCDLVVSLAPSEPGFNPQWHPYESLAGAGKASGLKKNLASASIPQRFFGRWVYAVAAHAQFTHTH